MSDLGYKDAPPPAWPPPPVWPPAPPQAWPPAPARRTHPRATAALIIGLVSLIGMVLILPAALGPVACYLGASARREIEREPSRWDGRGSATAGLVLGIIASALFVLLTVMTLFSAAMFALMLGFDTGY